MTLFHLTSGFVYISRFLSEGAPRLITPRCPYLCSSAFSFFSLCTLRGHATVAKVSTFSSWYRASLLHSCVFNRVCQLPNASSSKNGAFPTDVHSRSFQISFKTKLSFLGQIIVSIFFPHFEVTQLFLVEKLHKNV